MNRKEQFPIFSPQCIMFVKPVPHLVLNDKITDCIDKGDCAYTETYAWVGENSKTYSSCNYVSETSALCFNQERGFGEDIVWQEDKWMSKGIAICENQIKDFDWEIYYVANDLGCLQHCKPKRVTEKIQAQSYDIYDYYTEASCCSTSDSEYEQSQCMYEIPPSSQFEYYAWLESYDERCEYDASTYPRWSCLLMNECPTTDVEKNEFYIPYLDDINANADTDITQKCLSHCRPDYKVENNDDFRNTGTALCCNTQNPEDVSVEQCNKVVGVDTINEWFNDKGWISRGALCEVDSGFSLPTENWYDLIVAEGWDWDTNEATCPIASSPKFTNSCHHCQAEICDDITITPTIGECRNDYADFGIQYSEGFCYKCANPPPPRCPAGSSLSSFGYFYETNSYQFQCSNGKTYITKKQNESGTNCFNYEKNTANYSMTGGEDLNIATNAEDSVLQYYYKVCEM
jgi:hypothetical protein